MASANGRVELPLSNCRSLLMEHVWGEDKGLGFGYVNVRCLLDAQVERPVGYVSLEFRGEVQAGNEDLQELSR